MESEKSVKIVKGPRRFTVNCDYDADLVKYFRTIEKRFFNHDDNSWSFPNRILVAFKKEMASQKVAVTELDGDKVAQLIHKKDNMELKFPAYIKEFNKFKEIAGAKYLRNEKCFVIPLGKEEELKELLSGFTVEEVTADEEEESNVEPPAKKPKLVKQNGKKSQAKVNKQDAQQLQE